MLKVRRNKIELLTFVMILFVVIITLFGCINIYNSCKIINNQANERFIHTANDIKEMGNNYFFQAQREVERCKKVVEITLDEHELKKVVPNIQNYDKDSIPYVSNYMDKVVAPLLFYTSGKIDELISIYFDFDTKLLKHKDIIGVWYTDSNLDNNFELTDSGPRTDMYPENKPQLNWYYEPKKLQKGVCELYP